MTAVRVGVYRGSDDDHSPTELVQDLGVQQVNNGLISVPVRIENPGLIWVALIEADNPIMNDDDMIRRVRAMPNVGVIDMRGLANAFKKLSASPAVQQLSRIEEDRRAMARVGRSEMRIAQRWLSNRMDAMYADLGLTR